MTMCAITSTSHLTRRHTDNQEYCSTSLGLELAAGHGVRRSWDWIRVTGQLIDTLTGNHIWAERYDRVLEDIFAAQEEAKRAIVAVIAPQIEGTER